MVTRRVVAFSVVFYFDENLLRVAVIFAELYPNILYPGHPHSPISLSTKDPAWIVTSGAKNWISITRDGQMLNVIDELETILRSSARLVLLGDAGQWKTDRIVRLLRSIWSDLPRLSTRPGPWVYYVTEDDEGKPVPDLWAEEKLLDMLAELNLKESQPS